MFARNAGKRKSDLLRFENNEFKEFKEMKICYNRLLPVKGFSAMALFGVIFARRECRPLSKSTIRHEEIHKAQAKECGGWLLFYLKYLYWWVRRGYRNIPFEKEAYANERDEAYLDKREPFAWKGYE